MFTTDVGAYLVFKHQTVNSHEHVQLISPGWSTYPLQEIMIHDLIRPYYLRETTCHISGAWVPQWGREVDTGSRL